MRAADSTSTRAFRPLYLGHLAVAHANRHEDEIAAELIEDALGTVEATDERFIEADLYRIRAELLLRTSPRRRTTPSVGSRATQL